jgi:hypothetical protein
MLKCVIRGAVNLTLFVITFGWSFLLNVADFFIDVFNVYHERSKIVDLHDDLLMQIDQRVKEIKNQRWELYKRKFELIDGQKNLQTPEIQEVDKQIHSLDQDIKRFGYEKSQIEQKTIKTKKERKKALTVVVLVLIGAILSSPIPGLNIGVMGAAACLLVALSFYVIVTRSWEVGQKTYKTLQRAYHHYTKKNPEISYSPENTPNLAPQSSMVSTETIKQHLRENINFLRNCQKKVPNSGSIAATFALFTPNEVTKLRKIFNLTKDDDWQKRLKDLFKYSKDDHGTKHRKSNHAFYRCSFKKLLEHRITEEYEFGDLLDSDKDAINNRLNRIDLHNDVENEKDSYENPNSTLGF